MHVRAISWNVNCRTGRAMNAQVEALVGREPDLVALQEVTRDSISDWREALAAAPCGDVIDSADRLAEYPTANVIASRWPLRAFPPLSTPRPERFLSAIVETDLGPLELHNAHIPDGSRNGWGKIQGFVDLYASLQHEARGARILCGDFNSPREETADESVTFWGDGDPLWTAAERSVLLGLEDSGLIDVFRAKHGYDVAAASWIERRTRRGRRYDHMLASPELNIDDVQYHPKWLESRLSDHAAIEATFEWRALEAPVEPIDLDGLLRSSIGESLATARGRKQDIIELGGSELLVGADENRSEVVLRLEWIEAAARRLQVDGKLDVSPSILGWPFATIGAILASAPGVRWKTDSRGRVDRRWLVLDPAED